MIGTNIYNITGWFCLSTGINEAAKYYYIRTVDPEKTAQYDEYKINYKSLMRSYQKGITLKLMIYSLMGIDQNDYDSVALKSFLHQKIKKKFNEEIILSKYI